MNQTHLATLLAVLEEGSFDAAAVVLGISPSAVSQRIKALESDIGRVLVRRSSPVEATESGEVLAQAARRMALLQAETDVALRRTIARVPLSIAINADSLATWFPPVFSEVAQWETATLRLRVEDESRSMTLLRRGDCLGAITTEATAVTGCDVKHLGALRYRAMATPELAAQYTDATGQIDWAHMPTLRYGPNDKLQTRDLAGRLEGKPVHRRISEIPSSEAFLEAARRGLGWALVSELQGMDLVKAGELVILDDIVAEVHLYWQYWRLESAMLQQLTEAVTRIAGELLD